MEGRTGLPVSGTPPFPAPVPPPHGTVPAPAVSCSDSTVLSPVFADLPGGPNGGATRTSTAVAAAASSIASPGHANYQGKLFSSSVASLGAGSGFSYLGNYISPPSTDSFKQSSGVVAQPASMNQYWLSNSEGYAGFSVSGAHSYPPYLTTLSSLPGPGTQGLLAVSATAKSESQRIPASHHTRSSDLWDGPPSKLNKTSPHALKEGALSPKSLTHPPAKSRHASGSEDRKGSKHEPSRSKNKDRVLDSSAVEEKKELTASKCGKTSSKEKGCDSAPKTEQKLELDSRQDLPPKKSDKLSESKQKVPSNPGTLTIEINNGEELSTSASKCNGDASILSPRNDSSKSNPSLQASSPKSKESSSEKRKKASKRKDLSVDLNGNAVLSSIPGVAEKKIAAPTATVVYISENLTPVASSTSETPSASDSTHLQGGAESTSKNQPAQTQMHTATYGNNRTSSSAETVSLTASPLPSVTVPSSDKLSPHSHSGKVSSPTSAPLLSTSRGCSSHRTDGSAATSPSGKTSVGVISMQTSSPGVIMSTSSFGDYTQRTSASGDPHSSGADVSKINSLVDIPTNLNSSDISHLKACPAGAGPATSNVPTSSPLGATASVANPSVAHPTDVNPKAVNATGVNPPGTHPSGTYPKGTSPILANPSRESPTRASPQGTFSSDGRTTEANPSGVNPTGGNPAGLSPSGGKPPRSSPSTSSSLSSPHSVISSELSRESPVEKEKLPSPRSLVATTAFSTCVTSSVSKPISFPAHGSLPSPSSQTQPSYISHLPIYLHGTGHLSLEREVGRETPRDGSKVHATTFVPALGEFIPGPACSATIQVKESKTKGSANGKESNHGPLVSDREKDKASLKKDPAKVGTTALMKEQTVALPKGDTGNEKIKVGSLHQDGGTKSKESLDSKSTLTKAKGEKSDKHDKSKKGHASSRNESRDHHLSPSELSAGGKERALESTHRTTSDSIHRETCRTSDAAIISTTPSVHGYPHHIAGYSLPLGSMVPSSRDGSKLEAPPTLYSTEEQRRYLEWHMAAAKRGYCYEHPGIRVSNQEPQKLDPSAIHRMPHQPSFPSPRTESRAESIPEHSRGRDYPSYTAPQESMLRSVLTAGMHQAHSEAQRTSPGSSGNSSGKATKQSSETKIENRTKTASHGGKASSESLGSQGRSTPGTKGSDGRNPPVGIAVAQKRQDSDSVSQGRPSTITTPRNSPHVGSDEVEDRGARTRAIHGADRDSKHREHSPRSHREATDLLPPSKYHHHRYPGELGSNLIVTGGTSLGPSPHHFDPTDGRMTPSHQPHLALPPHWLPRAPGPPHVPSLWLGHPFGLTTPPAAPLHAAAGEGASSHLQVPPGLPFARDPATGHVVLVPQAPPVHSDSSVPPNLSMWPYLVPSHLQPHSHQLQQLVLNQPSFAPPLPHQSSHPMTHRPDQPLSNADYHFALQQHQEALAQWYRQDEQRQREEQRRREQQSRKSSSGGGEKPPSDSKSHKGGLGAETKSDSHSEKQPASHSHDVLNLKIPPHTPYLPGVPLPGQPPVPYVYQPQQVQYLYNHAGVYPAPAVSCSSSPRTESGASTASPKQTTTKSSSSSDGNKNGKSDNSLKTALKSISVQTSPSETPASVEDPNERKLPPSEETEENEEKDCSLRTEESEDQELIIVDVVNDDASDNQMLESEKISQENKTSSTPANSATGPAAADTTPVEDSRTSVMVVDPRTSTSSSALPTSTEMQSDVNLDPAMAQKIISETVIPIAPLTTPPLDTEVPLPETLPPPVHEEPDKESLISNVLTTTQSFASRMEALDQDQLAAIEGIALLSEVADQKVFSICNEDKANATQTSQTRDDSYLLDARHQDNGTPLQGNTASALTSASGGTLHLISQSCPTSPTEFIFKRSTSGDSVDSFASPGDILNPNEVEMTQRLAELQRKYQEKKRELDKLQRKKDKKDKGSRSLDQDRRRGPGRPRKRKISKESQQESGLCPIIKSSTAVLLEAAASLEESSPFLVPKKKKKKKDREDKEKGKTEDKKESSKKDKETKAGHSETSKSKKRKHKSKEAVQDSPPTSEDVSSSSSGGKSKSKSKSKSSSSPSPSSKDSSKQKATSKSRKVSLTDSASSDSLAKSAKSPKTSRSIRRPRSQNSSTEFDTDSSSIIWPSTSIPTSSCSSSSSSSKTPAGKSKSKSSKKKSKEAKVKDGKKDGVKGQGSSNPAEDATIEAIENVIRKSCDGLGSNEKEPARSGTLQHALHIYEDDSDSPWETAMIDAKQKKNSGHTPQKGLALLAGISSQELMKSTKPFKDSKTALGKDPGDGKATDAEVTKKKSGKAKKRSISPATSEQGTPKKARKLSPVLVKKEKDFESPSKLPKSTKSVKKKEKTPSEPTPKSTLIIKQEKKDPGEKPFFNEEIWTRRRSERIFLSDISPGPSRDASPLAKGHELAKTPRKVGGPPNKPKALSESSGGEQGASSDHSSTANIGSVLDALKTDTLQIRKKLASMSAQEDEKDDAPRKTKKKLSKKRDQGKKSSSKQDGKSDSGRFKHNDDILDSSCSEAENLPLSNFLDRQNPPPPRSCIISKEELQNGLRVLIPIDGLFYAGTVNAIQPPDVYGVILDGERGSRPHVFSQEQMLQETFVDVKPLSTRYVPEGTRVCAYWSQQFRCLYPGTVVKGTPNPNEDTNFVCVEFDDGDSGRIPVDHIRMLPHDFPIVEFEPIPAELQRKRRRRTSDTSCSTSYKQEKGETSEGTSASKAKTSSSTPKKKPKTTASSKSAADQQEMDRISESGEDDVFLPQTQKFQSKSKKTKSHDKSKKSSSKVDSKLKEKKKKKKRKREERRQESGERKRSKRSSSKSPRRSPARSPSRSPGKSKKKKRKEDRKKKSSSKLSSSNGDSSPKSKSSKKKSSSSSAKRKTHRDDRNSSFCTVETETVYSTHPITGSQVLTEEESASETPTFDSGKGVWNKHRDTRDHSLDDWSSTDSSKDSSSDSDETSSDSLSSKDNTPLTPSHKSRSSILPSTSKMTGSPSPSPSPCNAVAFLPARQLWNWFGKATQRRGAKGKARKVFYRAIMRENEIIRQGDAAVFLSTGRPHLPYIGRIESMWESWGGNMVVRVKWFYHPEETKGGRKSHDGKMALYQSLHVDENDVQTISHKCEVLSVDEYKRYASGKKHKYTVDSEDVYYLAGTYDPTSGHITSVT